VSPDEAQLLRQIQRLLKSDIALEAIAGFEPSRPIRLDGNAPGAARPGAQRPGGNRSPRKPGHRPHGKPADRGAHAHAHTGQKQGQGRGQGQGKPSGRRDSRA
jgi:ATP-dependent RNA helicase RhlE